MENARDEERQLPASERKLAQARERGQVARSAELPAALLVLLGAGALWVCADLAASGFARLVRAGLVFGVPEAFDGARAVARLAEAAAEALVWLIPFLAAALAAALLAPLAVGGWTFSAQALAPDPARLDPFKGLARIFSLEGAIALAKALAKAGAIGAVLVLVLWGQRGELAGLLALPVERAVPGAVALLAQGALAAALAFGAIAALDVPLAIWQHRRRLRMTREELRREQKETEGDPLLKARIRSIQRETARRRMMQAVPKADVVVTNPLHVAVALVWREGAMRAPQVVAKGRALLAARMRELAVGHGVPVVEAPPLARALERHVAVGTEVPQALYGAVAQVLAYVYQLRAARARGGAAPRPPAPEVPAELDPGR